MLTTPQLDTARLILKPLASPDAVQIQHSFPRWEIVRYLVDTVPWPYPPGAAQHYVDNIALAASARGEGWFWTLRRKAAPETLIGVICLMDTVDNNRGFWLVPEWQGQGLMSEACAAVNDFWFEHLDRTVLRAPKAAVNLKSVNISQRGGMRLIRMQKGRYVCGELETELWEMTRDEWRHRKNITD